ncbi:unnamed protein product [Heligmosomoides polygyrus]|uniref:Cyclic nucleotide-binding domain-containing protein n=1 Tax=Heligmosomoides polygyrus TaxID=6339 RepID=A0A183FEH9_HELPZ|nr:unnamed protein product [Heligmosomoides polygyrus]
MRRISGDEHRGRDKAHLAARRSTGRRSLQNVAEKLLNPSDVRLADGEHGEKRQIDTLLLLQAGSARAAMSENTAASIRLSGQCCWWSSTPCGAAKLVLLDGHMPFSLRI